MDSWLPQGFFEQLKRHYLFRSAAIYAVIAWLLIQASSSVLPNFGFPRDGVRFVIIVVALGFPVMLVLTWLFVKPRGLVPAECSRRLQLHWKLGSALSVVIIATTTVSGWFLWSAADTARQAQAVNQAVPAVPAVEAFNPFPRSIAVLPFVNRSDDPSQQYFSDGITEEITAALSALPGMHVTAWQSTSQFRGQNVSVTSVGKALNVANVLVGSVQRDGDRVRISVELASTVTGYQQWSSHYDRTFKDIFTTQDDISKAIVDTLQLQLASGGSLVTAMTTNTDAHEFYLKGLAANNAAPVKIDIAIADFQQAIRLDPKFADAYAALAKAYAASHQYTNVPLAKSLPLAKRAAKQALQLNPKLAAAHVALGMTYALERKPQRARDELRQVLALNPNDPGAHIIYATLLPVNDSQEKLAHYQQASDLDPKSYRSVVAHYNMAGTYEGLEDYDKAMTEYRKAIDLAPQLVYLRLDFAGLYHRRGDNQNAIAALSGIAVADPIQAGLLNAARVVYQAQAMPTLRNDAHAALQQVDTSKLSAPDLIELAVLYSVLADKDRAIQLLTGACANAPESCSDIAVNPNFRPLASEPRFQKLIKQYNLST